MRYAGFYIDENDQMVLFNMKKGSQIHNLYVENPPYFRRYT